MKQAHIGDTRIPRETMERLEALLAGIGEKYTVVLSDMTIAVRTNAWWAAVSHYREGCFIYYSRNPGIPEKRRDCIGRFSEFFCGDCPHVDTIYGISHQEPYCSKFRSVLSRKIKLPECVLCP